MLETILLTLLMAVGDNTPLDTIIGGDWWGGILEAYGGAGKFVFVLIYLVVHAILYIKLQDIAPVSISMIVWASVMFAVIPDTSVRFMVACFVFVGVAAMLWRLLKK